MRCRVSIKRFKLVDMLRLAAGIVVIIAVIVLIAAFYPNQSGAPGPSQVVGSQLGDLSFSRLGGGSIRFGSLRGRTVLLNVWATWCGPCRREMPALQRISDRFAGRLEVVAIDQGEDPRVVEGYVRRFHVRFPVGVDGEQRLGVMLHLAGLPSSFFVDADGRIREAVDGEMTYDMMVQKANRLTSGT